MAVQEHKPRLPHTRKFVTVLHNVFAEEECQALIDLSEQAGYTPANITGQGGRQIFDQSHRDSDRVIIDDPARAAELFRRVAPYLPTKMGGCSLAGINERLRFLRYDPGQKFMPHHDGCYMRPDGSEVSTLTIQLYLSGGPGQLQGGETCFLDTHEQVQFALQPRAGLVLVFDHQMYHSGNPVKGGRKYCIRSDVMYRR